MKYFLTFSSTHTVLKAESALKEKGIVFRLDPAPKTITEFCGLVISIEDEVSLKAATALLDSLSISPSAAFKVEGKDFIKIHSK